MPIQELKKLHEELTALEAIVKICGLPEEIDGDMVRSIREVQEIIEAIIKEEKFRQRMVTGKEP